MLLRARLYAVVESIVDVNPHEISALIHSSLCFFFLLSAYFVILPLRDDGAISLGLGNLPELFVGSLVLTLVAAPVSTVVFSLPSLSKGKALVYIHRFFALSLCVFFILWNISFVGHLPSISKDSVSHSSFFKEKGIEHSGKDTRTNDGSWGNHGWLYITVRICLFLWVALLNLVTISSTWARVIDVMTSESGSRLFGFVGAGATLGQLFGSLFAAGMAWLGPYLLLFSAILMELAAQSAKGICHDMLPNIDELSPIIRENSPILEGEQETHGDSDLVQSCSKPPSNEERPRFCIMLDGVCLILSSTYLLYISLFIWISAVVSSFFYFQKMNIVALTITTPLGRRRMLAEINSFIAIFILAGQLTLTGRILTTAGVTAAICSAPLVAFSSMVTLSLWPTWIAVAITETLRKVVTYVVARPGRELLFTVVTQDEKYKAKVCIDVIVQRLGDATAAGLYKLLFGAHYKKASAISLYALPLCFLWILTGFHLGGRQVSLAKIQNGHSPL
ncbi:Major facilitator transporter [Zostera marina]|uniref:Major facilitator transporter n=1 Tax=Zostera marina TaxID=29655 RepID=A0A0K9PH76_ZOSMR|nr:Major facilitator transporter [Zostera marina]